jgi:purine-binding chemotaxis protein CheW
MFSEKTLEAGFLEIRIKQRPYAIAVESVREINQVLDITPFPNSGLHVCGLMNLRGQVLPVIDLGVRLGMGRTKIAREACVIVVSSGEGLMGLLVDEVVRVMSLKAEAILPPPESCHLENKALAVGIAHENERIITLLNLKGCLEHTPPPKAYPNEALELLS